MRERGLLAPRRATVSARVRGATANHSLLGGGAAAAIKEWGGEKKAPAPAPEADRRVGQREVGRRASEGRIARLGSRGSGEAVMDERRRPGRGQEEQKGRKSQIGRAHV